ncbi:MAG: hypothetical protein K0R08_2013 [Solimicrobium sp.]|nr:hypothetical protein [Solimicrobium sp.]
MSKLNEYGPEKFLTQVIDESVKFPTQQEQDNFLEQIIDMLLVENCNSQDRDDVNKDSVRLNVSKVVNNILDNQEKGASHSAVEIVEAGLVKHVYESSRLNMWKNEEQVLERKISKLKPLHYGDQNVSIDPEEI